MTYDLALVTDGNDELGWGHAARMSALCVVAARRGLSVVLVAQNPLELLQRFSWPRPVLGGSHVDWVLPRIRTGADVVVYDGVGPLDSALGNRFVAFDDLGNLAAAPRGGTSTLVVSPHFGADPAMYPGRAALCGPKWMPLNLEGIKRALSLVARPVTYRLPASLDTVTLGGLPHHDAIRNLSVAPYAVLPPSTIAYEAIAMRVPVRLHTEALPATPMGRALERVGDAMVDAGAATWWGEPERIPRGPPGMVDDRGADRLLDFLGFRRNRPTIATEERAHA